MRTTLYGIALLLVTICGWHPVWAQSSSTLKMSEVVDRLHGIAYPAKEGWTGSPRGNAYLLHDNFHFILIRAARYDGNLQKLAQSWVSERKALGAGFRHDRYAFRQVGQGVVLVGEGLGYPYALVPIMSVNFGLTGTSPPEPYREITAILPGEKMALLVTLFFPEKTDKSKLDEMVSLLRGVRFLSAKEMVSWRKEVVRDAEVGMEAATLHVPEGFSIQGGVIRQGTKRMPVLLVKKDEQMVRIDLVDVNSMMLQTGFGGNATTIITINGQSTQLPQPVMISSEEEVIQLLLALWEGETGHKWELKERQNLPKSSLEQQMESRNLALPMMPPGMRSSSVKMALLAQSGSLTRVAQVQGTLVTSGQMDYIASTQNVFAGFMIHTLQAPTNEFAQASGIFTGVLSSWSTNPQHALSALQRFTDEQRRLNQMVLQMMKEHSDFNSRMATAWSNVLSNQTYVKDPQTAEVARVYKQSWESGGFWREPIFGEMLLSGVREGSKLEELLKMEGWRKLQESLEGFPQK
jgi:hypothetical protein